MNRKAVWDITQRNFLYRNQYFTHEDGDAKLLLNVCTSFTSGMASHHSQHKEKLTMKKYGVQSVTIMSDQCIQFIVTTKRTLLVTCEC
jgi:hypothetical protein